MSHPTVSWQDLVDYLAGEASEAVQQRVQQWLTASAQHQALMRLLRQLWEAAAIAEHEDPTQLKMQWQALLEKMQKRGLPLPQTSTENPEQNNTARMPHWFELGS